MSEAQRDDTTRTPSPVIRWALLVLLVVALVAGVAWALWLAAQRGEADERQVEREQVMQTSRTFMLRMGTYGPEMLDDDGQLTEYRERVREVITPKFRASFDETAPVVDQLVGQSGVSREAEVYSAGVSTIDEDSATALVAGTFTDTYTVKGEERPQEPVPFRIEAKLEKIEGEWLVDDYVPVVGEDAGSPGAPGGPEDPAQPSGPGAGSGEEGAP